MRTGYDTAKAASANGSDSAPSPSYVISSKTLRAPFGAGSSNREKQLRQDSIQVIGRTQKIRNRFYAISIERRLRHPAVIAICDTARQQFFRREAVAAA